MSDSVSLRKRGISHFDGSFTFPQEAEFDFCENVEMESSSPFQAFLTRQFERCLPMEVLMPGAELLADNNPGARPRTKTEDFAGHEIPAGRVTH